MIDEFGNSHKSIELKKYTAKEMVWVNLAKQMYIRFSREQYAETGQWTDFREIRVGKSEQNCNAWTDGHSYICFNRKFLRSLRYESGADIGKFGAVLLHEYCHRSSNAETDTHGAEFYELYHELAVKENILGRFYNEALMKLPDILAKQNLKENHRVSRFVDKAKAIEAEGEKAKELASLKEMAEAVL